MITVGYGSYLNVRAFTINGAQCVLVWLITSVFENTQKTESTKMLLNEIVLLSTLKILNRNKVDQTEKKVIYVKGEIDGLPITQILIAVNAAGNLGK